MSGNHCYVGNIVPNIQVVAYTHNIEVNIILENNVSKNPNLLVSLMVLWCLCSL